MPTKTTPPLPPPLATPLSTLTPHVLDPILTHPERFLRPTPTLSHTLLTITKSLYAVAKTAEPFPNEFSPLQELLVEGFDAEQVWEQLQLQNAPMGEYLGRKVEQVGVEWGKKGEEMGGESEGMEDGVEDGMSLDGYDDLDAALEEDADLEEGDDDEDEDSEGVSDEEEEEEEETNGRLDKTEDDDEWADGLGEGAGDDMEDDSAAEGENAEEEGDGPNSSTTTLKRKSEIDDDFFSLEEMEKFADFGESRDHKKARKANDNENDGDDSEEDEYTFGDDILNADNWDDDGEDGDELEDRDNANEIRYEDFFGPREKHGERGEGFTEKKGRRVGASARDDMKDFDDEPFGDADMSDDGGEGVLEMPNPSGGAMDGGRAARNLLGDDDENDEEATQGEAELSRFEKQQERLQKQIAELEHEALAEKTWALKGEVASKSRPINSLLEEDLEFDNAAKPVPVITEEVTATLEDMIKQRIKDALFDDVVRKAPPRDRNNEYDPNRRIEINEEKSSKSLAQVYEEDYARRNAAAKGDPGIPTEKDEALAKQHSEIDGLFTTLCRDLDALSNWHFTPKTTAAEDADVIVPLPNVAALEMEEVTPAAASNKSRAAPQEVFAAPTTAVKGDTELTSGDKKRLRDKSRKTAGKKRAVHQAKMDAVVAARPQTALAQGAAKQSALKQLMGQKNVTIVADAKMTRGMEGVRGGKKGGKGGMKASVVQKGGKVGEKEKVERAQFLKL
ncbi:U3 small nucleolar ribonucleoprotein complex, subunit Mpp10 [Fimicolochytrium jonesii]|uniref:U3 small nucleolar ribonucleoprotein complex, subunit Mpp10 n=1 Tax=Fimicolochytrium jonesii TaxID=1396493 RepID=UPI0022FEDF9B|nr:U3 small nucleolar ribonucleoprotein complex, subunit Mpp10 [Fimicolochytrium jonesii]KAI8817048.1 U3 small nucleolar ribonucleoprotein complex, subunit Mpp10 [Fimicolochytrium jonesii]